MTAAQATETTASQGQALLELKHVTKSFGAVRALTDVDFEVAAGEVVALVGDNGAGKSTLVKAISGIQPGDSYEAFFEGRPVSLDTPQDGTRIGIATVYQDLALCDNLDVVQNLYLGRELTSARLLDEIAMEERTLDLMRQLAVTTITSVRNEVGGLSGGQRQSVAIARSLLGDPKVVMLDEPTAALGVAQTRQVLDLVKRLRDRGLGVVVISHNLADIFEMADRIVVLRLGRRVATFDRHSSTPEEVVAAITGVGAGKGEQ
ncbi:MAG: D-xylose transport system ATP-binding protein [Thermoleophilaceae bacterium]|jgi:D-xylose transport system ATP-binding protein|nr:D-xylose transport system ATP-binding protein [Thermoleophilaceae bacterium]